MAHFVLLFFAYYKMKNIDENWAKIVHWMKFRFLDKMNAILSVNWFAFTSKTASQIRFIWYY